MKAIFAALIVVFGFSAAMAVEGEASKMEQSKGGQTTETNVTDQTDQGVDTSTENSKEGTTATEETK